MNTDDILYSPIGQHDAEDQEDAEVRVLITDIMGRIIGSIGEHDGIASAWGVPITGRLADLIERYQRTGSLADGLAVFELIIL